MLCGAAHITAVDASSFAHACMCVDKWCPTASTLCPLNLPHKKIAEVRVTVMLKTKLNGPFSENFLATGGFFECNTVLGCLKKEEQF